MAAVTLACPASASAGSVESRTARIPESPPFSTVSFVAGDGEGNRVTVSAVENETVVVSDAGAPLAMGPGCTALDDYTARCRFEVTDPERQWVGVDAGDGDDEVRAWANRVDGGAGRDRLLLLGSGGELQGGSGDDELVGDERDNLLEGGGGQDVLRGGGGGDVLRDQDDFGYIDYVNPKPPLIDSDVLDGGAGRDLAAYDRRSKPLRIDLADPGPDGQAGEDDVLRGIEDVDGGSGDDVLAGNKAGNSIDPRGGADGVYGRGGDDVLATTIYDVGPDRLNGGSGNDSLGPLYGGPGSAMSCGSGRDTVHSYYRSAFPGSLRGADRLDADCERASFETPSARSGLELETRVIPAQPLRVTATEVTFVMRCPADRRSPFCFSGLKLLREGTAQPLGASDFVRIPAGSRRRVTAELSAAGRLQLRKTGKLKATLVWDVGGARVADSAGYSLTVGRR